MYSYFTSSGKEVRVMTWKEYLELKVKKMKVYRRSYDSPLNPDGSEKLNEFLGEFEIIESIHEDSYSGIWIGAEKDKVYLIREFEVAGVNGGSRYEVKELKSLTKL